MSSGEMVKDSAALSRIWARDEAFGRATSPCCSTYLMHSCVAETPVFFGDRGDGGILYRLAVGDGGVGFRHDPLRGAERDQRAWHMADVRQHLIDRRPSFKVILSFIALSPLLCFV